MLPLAGYRMLDLSRLFPGPFASHILADMGMEVIKVEETQTRYGMGRDVMTPPDLTPELEMRSAAYNSVARNKKSIALNLLDPQTRPQAQEVFYALAKTADAILEGYRPGVVKWMGIDYETIAAFNPGIVYASLSGYGQTGPYIKYPGHDNQFCAVAGTLSFTKDEEGLPRGHGVALGDCTSGIYTALGILAALIQRDKTGQGQQVDVSMLGSAMSYLIGASASYFRSSNLPRPGRANITTLKCKDGKYLTTGNAETIFWENFCRAIGHEEYIPLRRQGGPRTAQMAADIKELFLTKTRGEWLQILRNAETCVSPVNELDEALTDPQVEHIGMVWEVDHPLQGKVKQMGFPIRFSKSPATFRNFAPLLGEHTTALLQEVGFSSQKIRELEAKGVVKAGRDGQPG